MPTSYPFWYTFHFYLFGILAVGSALLFVTRKSPVAAALWLVNVMFCLAAEYILLGAHFIGAIQVLVYAGAIMVVFLFVIMLLNLGHPSEIADARGRWGKLIASALGLLFMAELWVIFRPQTQDSLAVASYANADIVAAKGAVGAIAEPMFNDFLLAFEVTSILLLAAIVGAVAIGRRRGEATGPVPAAERTNAR
jgi:NADH-quinone oxidoreductase subunit J